MACTLWSTRGASSPSPPSGPPGLRLSSERSPMAVEPKAGLYRPLCRVRIMCGSCSRRCRGSHCGRSRLADWSFGWLSGFLSRSPFPPFSSLLLLLFFSCCFSFFFFSLSVGGGGVPSGSVPLRLRLRRQVAKSRTLLLYLLASGLCTGTGNATPLLAAALLRHAKTFSIWSLELRQH